MNSDLPACKSLHPSWSPGAQSAACTPILFSHGFSKVSLTENWEEVTLKPARAGSHLFPVDCQFSCPLLCLSRIQWLLMLHWPSSSCNKQCHDVLVLSSLFYLVDLFKLSINWLFTLHWRLEEFLISHCFHFLGLEFNWSPKNHIWLWVFTFVMEIMNGCRQKVFPLSSVRCLWQKSRSACCELHPFQQKARMSLLQKKTSELRRVRVCQVVRRDCRL